MRPLFPTGEEDSVHIHYWIEISLSSRVQKRLMSDMLIDIGTRAEAFPLSEKV